MTADPKAAASKRGMPIAVVLVIAVGVLVLTAVFLVFVAGYEVARRNTQDLIRERSDLLIESIIANKRTYLEPARADLEYVAELLSTGTVDPADQAALGQLLRASLAAAPQISVIAFLYPDLTALRAFRNRPGRPVRIDDWSEDAAMRETLSEVERADGSYWGDLFVAEGADATFINVRMPVRRDGAFLGALIAGLSIEQLSTFVATLGSEDSGRAFILYGRERVLAHPRLLDGFAGRSDAEPLPRLADYPDPVLQALWDPARRVALPSGLADVDGAHAVEVDGRPYVVLLRRVDEFGDIPWFVGTYQDLDALSVQLERLGLIPRVAIAIIVVALVLAMLLARGLSRPARDLAAAANMIRDLDLARAPVLKRGPYRELNQAAEAFNAMVRGLRSFETYVPRALVTRLMQAGDPGAVASETREVTVLFTDIAGFTAFAEDLPASEVADFLNAHFALLDTCVEAEGGTIDKYIGDSLMAFWGAPERQADHAGRACRAALGIAAAVRADNARRIASGKQPVRLRMGIHTGPVLVGNIGAPSRVNYTIIGDSVNTAERLEGFARNVAEPDADVVALLSGETAALLGPSIPCERLGKFLPPGRQRKVEVYRLTITQ